MPREDVEVKVGQVFESLTGPMLSDTELQIKDKGGNLLSRVEDVMPAQLPDLYQGDQLILLGKYKGKKPLTFVIRGNYLGKKKTFTFDCDLKNATTRNAFVPRLWASRKIGILSDAIRQLGADADTAVRKGGLDPQIKELTDEIMRLTTQFGILTEYTSFLAREGSVLTSRDNLRQAISNYDRAINIRSGISSLNQTLNFQQQKNSIQLNPRNGYFDSAMNRVVITNVQQVNDRAFFYRSGTWVDGRLIDKFKTTKPKQVIEFGTDEFRILLTRLTAEGRQGTISLRGKILMLIDGNPVLVTGPDPTIDFKKLKARKLINSKKQK
jgi:Ca-activated chloride channel family protein